MNANSVCKCGHLGDGPHSGHRGLNGHGSCWIEGCRCEQFTWVKFTSEYEQSLKRRKVSK